MATITRWDPFGDMVGLRDAMDRLMNDAFVRPARYITERADAPQEFGMPVDVTETEDAIVVKAALPGVKADDLDISLIADLLSIKGEYRTEADEKQASFLRKEIRTGTYSRTLTLPVAVQGDQVDASFEDGVLTLTLPKVEEVKPKQIKIQPKVSLEAGSQN